MKLEIVIPDACDRCVDGHPATTTREFCNDDRRITLRLCDAAAERFDADLFKWEKLGTELPPHRPITAPRNGLSVAPVPIPKRVAPDASDDAGIDLSDLLPAEYVVPPDFRLPQEAIGWRLTRFARDKVDERNLDLGRVLLAAVEPTQTRDGTTPGTLMCGRDDVMVITSPDRKIIITAYRLTNLDRKEA
jgi:hypothetical protein